MSDIQHAIRQFGDAIKEAEERQAGHLGEVKDGIRATGNDIRRRIRTAMAKIEAAKAQIAFALADIADILEQSESADGHIMTEIEGIRAIALTPTTEPTKIEHQQEETDNGK